MVGGVIWCGSSRLGLSVLFLGFSGVGFPFIWCPECEPTLCPLPDSILLSPRLPPKTQHCFPPLLSIRRGNLITGRMG